MKTIRRWRHDATAHQDTDTRAYGYGVRELRQAHENISSENKPAKDSTKETGRTSAQAFAAALTFQPLPLYRLLFRFLPGEPFPSEAASSNLTAHKREPLGIGQLSAIVSKRLFIKISEQVIRLHADVSAVQLSLHQAPEIFHGVGMHAALCVLYGMIHNGALIFRVKPIVRFERVTVQ